MQKNIERFFFFGVVIVVLSVVTLLKYHPIRSISSSRSNAEEPLSGAKLVLDYDNQQRVFQGPLSEQMSFIQALYVAATAGKFDFRYATDHDRTHVMSIDGHADDGKHWYFYRNNQEIDQSVLHQQIVHERDVLRAEYR